MNEMNCKLSIHIILFLVICLVAGCAIFGEQKGKPVALVLSKEVTLCDISPIEEEYKDDRTPFQEHFTYWFPIWRLWGMDENIVYPLMEKYAKENGLVATKNEIQSIVRWTRECGKAEDHRFTEGRQTILKELENPALSEKDREAIRRRLNEYDMLCDTLRACRGPIPSEDYSFEKCRALTLKVNKALFERYGGRVLHYFPECAKLEHRAIPLDAHRLFLKDAEQRGWLRFLDADFKAEFWRFYTNDVNHVFYPDDVGAKIMVTLPWAPDYDFDEIQGLIERSPADSLRKGKGKSEE